MTYTQLTKNAAKVRPGFAVYALKHTPTGGIYVGSTLELPKRLMNWYYAFSSPTTPLPARVMQLVLIQGRDPLDWAYSILDDKMPPGYKPRTSLQSKPEWAWVQVLKAKAPLLVLNDETGKGGRPTTGAKGWGPRGVSPIKYLNVRLGRHRGNKYAVQPPYLGPIDPRTLVPLGALHAVPFAEVLLLAMKNNDPRHLNPSPAAIDELYQTWKQAQPAGFSEGAALPGTITTADGALSLPDPSVWLGGHTSNLGR